MTITAGDMIQFAICLCVFGGPLIAFAMRLAKAETKIEGIESEQEKSFDAVKELSSVVSELHRVVDRLGAFIDFKSQAKE